MSFVRPPPLAASARVHFFAPSSPFERERFDRGLTVIEKRYRVSQGAALFARQGYFAGDDAARLADLQAALDDPTVGALIAARGGYGATRLLPKLDVAHIRQAKRWLVGFSDVTALHALWARAGLCSLHGPMVCSLPEADLSIQRMWFDLLEGALPAPLLKLSCLQAGRAEGRLFGGNLTVLGALAGTPFMPPLDDVVLLLEDVGERPYRLDRTLTTLEQAGCFDRVRAFVLGQFSDCHPGLDGVAARDVLQERLPKFGVPVLADAPIGHVGNNVPVLLGAQVEVDGARGSLTFQAP